MKKTHKKFLSAAVNVAVTHRRTDSITAALDGMRKSNARELRLISDIMADPRFYKVASDSFLWKKYAEASIEQFINNIDASLWKSSDEMENLRNGFLTAWMTRNVFPLSTLELKREIKKLTSLPREEIKRLGDADFSEEMERQLRESIEEDFGEDVFDCSSGKLPDEAGIGGGEEEAAMFETPIPLKSYDSELQRLAMMIGRNEGETVVSRPGRFLRASKSDIVGISVGNDLSAVLPAELALLSTPATENIFYDRYIKNKLQVFASASEVKARETGGKTGPVIISIDTSGSMGGTPERMAKSLSLAICEIAQRRRRPVCLINYSDSVAFFILTNIHRQREKLMRFLGQSYGGGNNEETMFRFLFERLPASQKYSAFKDTLENADLLVVSDFLWMPLSKECTDLLDKARSDGMRFYALGIGSGIRFTRERTAYPEDGGEWGFGGYGFFDNCDYRFVYDDGVCKEITPKQHNSKHKRSCQRK